MFQQQSLFSEAPVLEQVINVSQVKQLSPFRYPGGKTWLVPHIKHWLIQQKQRPDHFIEPFAGGGIVSLTVAYERLAKHVIMSEIDQDIAAVWRTIFEGDVQWLVNKIVSFDLTKETAQLTLAEEPGSVEERAFQTILRNRISHGGIITQGAGIIKNGENGKGLTSRWYPATLRKRIEEISKIKTRITFVQSDGFNITREYLNHTNILFFFDPPYTAGGKSAGRRLYTHSEIDHNNLFYLASKIKGSFLMTYEISDEVKSMAAEHSFDTAYIPMQNRHNAIMKELLVSNDLSWLQQKP